jgi:molybdenum cofactor guanylyltransferase
MKTITYTAVLFAGGESRRMGTDKAALIIAGEALWRRQLKTLRQLRPDVLWISARTKPAWAPRNVDIVLDASPSRGPLSGLCSALATMKTTHLLALAIDLSQMRPEQLVKLCGLARPGMGVIPKNGEFYEPLCAIYPASAAPIASEALERGQLSLQSLVSSLIEQNAMQIFSVKKEDQRLYKNLNTPADLAGSQEQT